MKRFFMGLAPGVLTVMLIAGCAVFSPFTDADKSDSEEPQDAWFYGQPIYVVYPPVHSEAGDLASVTTDLERIASEGYAILCLMPPFPPCEKDRVGYGNPFAVRDYFAIDPRLGTQQDLCELVETAHDLGLRVILDMPLNHAATDHVLLDDHPDWFTHDSTGALSRKVERWTDVADWKLRDPEVREYLVSALTYWVDECHVDGFRFLHAPLLDYDFSKQAAEALHEVDPDLFLLAEAPWPFGFTLGFDGCYNPTVRGTLEFCRLDDMAQIGLRDDVVLAIEDAQSKYPAKANTVLYLEDHYTARARKVFGGYPTHKPFIAAVFLPPGTPMVYAGQEIGTSVSFNPVNPGPVAWDNADEELHEVYLNLLALRKTSPSLRKGDFTWLNPKDNSILVFTRRWQDETILAGINLTHYDPTFTLLDSLAEASWVEWDWDNRRFATEAPVILDQPVKLNMWTVRLWRRVE